MFFGNLTVKEEINDQVKFDCNSDEFNDSLASEQFRVIEEFAKIIANNDNLSEAMIKTENLLDSSSLYEN